MNQNQAEKIQVNPTKRHWDRRARGFYEYKLGEIIELPASFENFYQKHKTEFRKVLDVGCGTGKFLIKFLQDGLDVTGLDISDEMIEGAKKNLEKAKDTLRGNVQFMEGESKNLSVFADGSFGFIFAKGSIHHNNWAGIEQSFREANRVLPVGGIFIFQCRSINDPALSHSERISDDVGITAIDSIDKIEVIEHYFDENELRKLATENGFEIVVEPEERINNEPGKESARYWVVYRKI